ncbi:hypothetical protein QR685DRAFT_121192 [Neurospora intermedia]|uniref:Transmembrane protein n=1 Tax=Neurospora intermedia TaxID=5142 RepID=A0ABR3D097_NEUIN
MVLAFSFPSSMIFSSFLSLDRLRHALPPQMLNPSTQQSQASYCRPTWSQFLFFVFLFFSSLPVILGVSLASIRLNRFFGSTHPPFPLIRPSVRLCVRSPAHSLGTCRSWSKIITEIPADAACTRDEAGTLRKDQTRPDQNRPVLHAESTTPPGKNPRSPQIRARQLPLGVCAVCCNQASKHANFVWSVGIFFNVGRSSVGSVESRAVEK